MDQGLISRIPNSLTFVRIVLIPVFVILMILSQHTWAAVVFALAAFTDFLDGLIARRFNVVTDLGKLLDPVADKILVMAALVMLVAERSIITGESWVPPWMVVLVLARETWVTGLRAVAASEGKVIPADKTGKIKSFLQMLAVLLLLMHDYYLFPIFGWLPPAGFVGERLLLLSILFSYWGAFGYTRKILLG